MISEVTCWYDLSSGDKIPGGATLVFDVELVEIQEDQKPQNVFKDIDLDDDNLLSQDEVSISFQSFAIITVGQAITR